VSAVGTKKHGRRSCGLAGYKFSGKKKEKKKRRRVGSVVEDHAWRPPTNMVK
jgi:hypothetical protein